MKVSRINLQPYADDGSGLIKGIARGLIIGVMVWGLIIKLCLWLLQ